MVSPSSFSEGSGEEWSRERERLLQQSIKGLGLKIEGTHLEVLVSRLHDELDRAGIKMKPRVYLSDEWACPDGVPIIGIPFYLADRKLSRIEDEIREGIEAETDEEILGYLRHEAGHAFNYAYKLYETEEWHELFGPYSRPYLEDFMPHPFSRNFVRHIPGWYAQKHPDEDFAESFAVWLTPDSRWQEVYKEWGCYKKLDYVDRIVKKLGHTDPLVSGADHDMAQEDLNLSVAEHYKQSIPSLVEVPAHFDGDLREIFESKVPRGKEGQWQPAHEFLSKHRRHIVEDIAYWTGLYDVLVKSLIAHLISRCKELDIWVNPDKSQRALLEITAFCTTLCMNKLYKGDFVLRDTV